MAKLRGPLLSMSARGQFGKSQVYSSWRGIAYARMLVTPSNPRSVAQTTTRDTFRYLNALFRAFGPGAQAPWNLYTIGRPMIPRNGLVKINLPILKDAADNTGIVLSPGARGGPALDTFIASAGVGAGEIQYTITPGVLPDGWAVANAYAVAIHDQDPHVPFAGAAHEDSVANPGPYVGIITGLTTAEQYHVHGFVTYTKPDGTIAASLSMEVTCFAG